MIVDLVPNHTSDEHAWFQAALAAGPGSPERERYLFRDGRGATARSRRTTGTRSSAARPGPGSTDGEWYLHLFDTTQPDLDWRNPEVGDMFEDVLRFWLDRGVDGFRVDVAHGLFKEESLRDQVVDGGRRPAATPELAERRMVERTLRDEPMWDQPEVHDVYRRWHQVLDEVRRRPDGRRRGLDPDRPSRWPASSAPTRCSQAFNFSWLLADVVGRGLRARSSTGTLDAARPGRRHARPGC